MRGLVLLSIETQTQGMDEKLLEAIMADLAMRGAVCHLEHIHLILNQSQDRLLRDEKRMYVKTDRNGRVIDQLACKSSVDQLSTYIYGRLNEYDDEDCDIALLTCGDVCENIAAPQLGILISNQMSRLFPIRMHVIFLQDQYVHNDAKTLLFMRYLEIGNQFRPMYYSSLNMLPWEDIGETRQRTRKAIVTLLRATFLEKQNPLLLHLQGETGWVESIAVRRIDPPVDQVRKIIIDYLMERFETNVLSCALGQDAMAQGTSADISNSINQLLGFIQESERALLIPDFNELLWMMPCRNPDPQMKEDSIGTPQKAWEFIRSIYGGAQTDALYARINPNMDALKTQYQEMRAKLTQMLLRQVIKLGHDSPGIISNVPKLLDQIGTQLISQVERHKDAIMSDVVYGRFFSIKKVEREAYNMAKLRYHCMHMVYFSAVKRVKDFRKQWRLEMTRDAVEDARKFLSACLIRLQSDYQQMRAVQQSQPVKGFFYNFRLEEAYRSWCDNAAIDCVSAREFYDLFTDDILHQDYSAAAGQICEGLKQLVNDHAYKALSNIYANIDSFFLELDFRSKQLQRLGMEGDLSGRLLDFIGNQNGQCPLLLRDTADHPFRVMAKTLVFRTTGSQTAGKFASLAGQAGLPVISDPYEKGVLLVMKYAGDALKNLLVNINNASDVEGK